MRKSKKGGLLIRAGMLLIIAAAALAGYNLAEDYMAGRTAKEAVQFLTGAEPQETMKVSTGSASNALPLMFFSTDQVMATATPAPEATPVPPQEIPDYILSPKMEMPVASYGGQDYIGVLMIPVIVFASPIVSFFNSKPEVVQYGSMLLHLLTPCFVLCCFNQIYAGALRGAGNSKAPMIIMLSSFVGFRQVYMFVMSRICNEVVPIALGYPAGWLVCSTLTLIYYRRAKFGKTSVVSEKA